MTLPFLLSLNRFATDLRVLSFGMGLDLSWLTPIWTGRFRGQGPRIAVERGRVRRAPPPSRMRRPETGPARAPGGLARPGSALPVGAPARPAAGPVRRSERTEGRHAGLAAERHPLGLRHGLRAGFEERHERATSAYLRRVARHRFLNAVRAKRTRPRFEHLEEAEASWVAWTGPDGGQTRRDALRRCLGRLRDRARLAIDLSYTEGRSRVEVAAALQMTVDGVKTLLRRSRQALKTCVEREVAR